MSLWSRMLARIAREPRSPDAARVPYVPRTLAGVPVTPDTAVTVSAVWACLRYISQTVAVLPWRVMKDTGAAGELSPRHNVDYLLNKRPNPEWSSFQFRETLAHWALRWGNGYAEIERDSFGRPSALWPIHPERVCVERDPVSQALSYEVENGTGQGRVSIAPENIFHIRGFGEGPVGVNVIAYAAQSIGWARAAQLFGAAFFGNGANPSGIVTRKTPLTEDGMKRLKAEFDQLYKGPRNSNKVVFLDNEMDYKSIAVEPDKAQFIETNQHLVEEVCRWFGVPPHKVMHLLRATFSNIEHQSIEVVVDSVGPWVKRFEDEADYKLFGKNRGNFYTKMNMRALLRGDFRSQAEGFRVYREMGVVNADEIRDYLDMNPLSGEGGDKYTMQGQYTTLERIGEEPVVAPAAPTEQAAKARIERMARVHA